MSVSSPRSTSMSPVRRLVCCGHRRRVRELLGLDLPDAHQELPEAGPTGGWRARTPACPLSKYTTFLTLPRCTPSSPVSRVWKKAVMSDGRLSLSCPRRSAFVGGGAGCIPAGRVRTSVSGYRSIGLARRSAPWSSALTSPAPPAILILPVSSIVSGCSSSSMSMSSSTSNSSVPRGRAGRRPPERADQPPRAACEPRRASRTRPTAPYFCFASAPCLPPLNTPVMKMTGSCGLTPSAADPRGGSPSCPAAARRARPAPARCPGRHRAPASPFDRRDHVVPRVLEEVRQERQQLEVVIDDEETRSRHS